MQKIASVIPREISEKNIELLLNNRKKIMVEGRTDDGIMFKKVEKSF